MAYCPLCGNFWIVQTGMIVKRAIMGRLYNGVDEPPDMACPNCEKTYA